MTSSYTRPIIECMSYLPQTTDKKNKVLTEKQQSFLDNLIQTGGDPKKAAELAGYSGNYHQVIKALRQEVIELASDVLARSAPQAAFKLVDIMNSDHPIPQVSNKLTAAQTILDRVGVSKSDKLDVTHTSSGGIFILPEKETIDIQAEEVEYVDEGRDSEEEIESEQPYVGEAFEREEEE